jgi:hypothetical protein
LGNTGNGVKAGVLAGLIYGVVLGILSYFTVISDKSVIISEISGSLPASSPFTPEQLYGIVVLLTPALAAIGGVIGGIIIGAVYGRFFERVPGANSIAKGVVVGIILWLLLSVLGGYTNLQYGMAVYLGDVGVGLVSALLFGFLLGYFYGRFTRPPKMDPAMAGL